MLLVLLFRFVSLILLDAFTSNSIHIHGYSDSIDYKTTTTCDGNTLHLSCKPSESIHLVRANYGRFSLSICNDVGKLDLRVNCMSFRSFLIMQDRCSGKSSCNATVSSHFFGDPCPGTPKYLEVQYHCVQNVVPSSSSTSASSSVTTTTRRPPTDSALPVDARILRPSTKPIDREIGSSSTSSSSVPSSSVNDNKNDDDGSSDIHQRHHHDKSKDSDMNSSDNYNANPNIKKGQSSSTSSMDDPTRLSRPNHVRHGHGHGSRLNSPSGHSHHPTDPSTANPSLTDLDGQLDPINNAANNNKKSKGVTHFYRPSSSSSSSSVQSSSHHETSKPHSRFNNPVESTEDNVDSILNPFGSRSSSSSPASSEPPFLFNSPSVKPKQSSGGEINVGSGRHCPPTFRRSLNWNYTLLGETSTINCPGGASGIARWQCSSTTGTWSSGGPDMSECRSYWLDSLYDRLERGSSVVDISTHLANMTHGKPIFSRDLETISNLIHQIVSTVRASKDWEIARWQPNAILEELLTSLVYSVSNLLSSIQDDAWLDLTPEKRKRIAFTLLDELEKSALLLAESTNRDGYFTVKRPNVLVAVHVLETNAPISLQFPTIEDTLDTPEWIRMEDSLFLPAQSLLQYSHQAFAKAVFLAYNRAEDLLRPGSSSDDGRLSKLQSYSSSHSLVINSRIIGAAIDHHPDTLSPSSTANIASLASSSHHHTPLTQPIIIAFRHLQEDNVSSPKCVYWSRESADWLTDGCSVAATNVTHTVCQCNHLSSFALLMEVRLPSTSSTFNLTDESSPINWLRLVVVIGSGISALCLLFILMILYTIHGDNREVLSIHKDLCLTLLIVQVTFFIGIFQTDNLLPCILSAGILHYFLLSSFLWSFLEAFDHFLNLIDVFETLKTTHRLWWYYCLAFGGPGLVTLLSIFINPHSYGSINYCWLRPDVTLWLTLVGPCTLALIASLVFICISAFIVCHNSAISTALKGKEQLKVEDIRCGLKWITFLLMFQCTNWILCYAYLTNQTSIPLGLTFACSNFLLGLYCIIFCIIRTDSVQHHKIAQHLPLMDWCFDGSETETSTKESVFSGSQGLTHHHHHHHSSLYGPSPVIPVVTHVTTQVSPYSDGTIRTFKTSHIINNTLALYESIESPPPPVTSTSTSTNNSGNNTLNNLQQSNHLHHLVNNIIPTAPPPHQQVSSSSTSTVGTLLGNTNGTSTFVSMSSSSSSSSTGGVGQQQQQQQKQHHQQNQLNQLNYHQIQPQQSQLAHHQLISTQHHQNNISLGIYGQSTLPGTNNLNNQQMIIGGVVGGGTNNHRNHSSLMLNNSLGLYESIEPPSPASSPTPYHHTSRNQIYLGHGSLSQHHPQQQHQQQQHLIGTSGRKHRIMIPSDFPV